MKEVKKDLFYQTNICTLNGQGYVYSLQFHFVWATKYRKPVLVGPVYQDTLELLQEIAKDLDFLALLGGLYPKISKLSQESRKTA